jgi:hypothetical protein
MPKMTQEVADAAARVLRDFHQDVRSARADDRLSDRGRQQRMALTYRRADAEMKKLKVNVEGGMALTAGHLQRKVFGSETPLSGADAISMRDAMTRAGQLKNADEAHSLLQQAELTGDDHLAKALVRRAFDSSRDGALGNWGGVIDAYAASRPDVARRLQELADACSRDSKMLLPGAWQHA